MKKLEIPAKRTVLAPALRTAAASARMSAKAFPRIKPRPPLSALASQPDPLSKLPEGTAPDEACKRELSEMDIAFREMRKKEYEQSKLNNDTKYYFVVVFDNGAQADAFIEQAGMKGQPDLFVDGRALADRLGFTLPEAEKQAPFKDRIDRRLASLVGDFDIAKKNPGR